MNSLLNPTIAHIAHEYVVWLLLFPALALGLLVVIEPYIEAAFARVLAALAATSGLGVSLWLANDLTYLVTEKRRFSQELGAWLTAPGLKINLDLIYDPLAAVVSVTICAVIALTAWQKIANTPKRQATVLMLLLISCLLTFLARDLLLFLLAWAFSGWLGQRLLSDSLAVRRGYGHTLAYVGLILDLLLVMATVILSNVGSSGDLLTIRFNIANLAQHLPPAATNWPAQLLTAAAIVRAGLLPAVLWRQRAFDAKALANLTPAFTALTLPAVYLFVRLSPLFAAELKILTFLAMAGAWTALYFAIAALLESSMVRSLFNLLLAQFGLVAVALGSGAFAVALASSISLLLAAFLLTTASHLVHQALVNAGDDADSLETMGGLGSRLPAAFALFTVAIAALVGFPPFSSFLSQHAVLWQSAASALRHTQVAIIAPIAAIILTVAAVSLWLKIFYGPYRGRPETPAQLHAPRWLVLWPAWLAASLAFAIGWWTSPTFSLLAPESGLLTWLRPVLRATIVQSAPAVALLGAKIGLEIYALFLVLALTVAGIAAWWADFSGAGQRLAASWPVRLLADLLANQFYLPELTHAICVRLPFGWLLLAAAALGAFSNGLARILAWPAAWLLPKASSNQNSAKESV